MGFMAECNLNRYLDIRPEREVPVSGLTLLTTYERFPVKDPEEHSQLADPNSWRVE